MREEGDARGTWLLRRLQERYNISLREYVSTYIARARRDPFKVLVATILSQNSTDKAAHRAFEALERSVGVSPQQIAAAQTRRLMSLIRVAGLHRQKARTLRSVSRIILERYGGSIGGLLSLPPEQARRELMSLPGVGPKTADVLLATLGLYPTVPVDTHIARVAKRLGLVREGAGYEEIRRVLDALFESGDRHRAHLLLIAHGRKTCRAINPLCHECLLAPACRYYRERRGRGQ